MPPILSTRSPTVAVAIKLPAADRKKYQALAKRRGLPLSELIRQLLAKEAQQC